MVRFPGSFENRDEMQFGFLAIFVDTSEFSFVRFLVQKSIYCFASQLRLELLRVILRSLHLVVYSSTIVAERCVPKYIYQYDD